MARPVQAGQLGQLAEYFKTRLPSAIRVLNLVQNVLSGRVDSQQFWVDEWPDPRAVLVTIVPGQFQFCRPRVEVWAEDGERLARLLNDVIDWTREILFTGLQLEFKPSLLSTVPCPDDLTFSEDDQYTYVWPEGQEPSCHVEIPAGLRLTTLSPEHAGTVTGNWRHSTNPTATAKFVSCLIRALHSSCLLDIAGTPIGYCTQYHYGAIGFLHVSPDFRRRGLAKVLLVDIAKQILGTGRQPYLVVEAYNTAAMALVTKVGFRRVDTGKCFAVWRPRERTNDIQT